MIEIPRLWLCLWLGMTLFRKIPHLAARDDTAPRHSSAFTIRR
jgi:hypothetical protein